MNCREFRETYTDLVDGLLGEADKVRSHEHVVACSRCRRFDRAYRLGVSALRGLPCPGVSRAFASRVLHTVRTDTGSVLPSFASGFTGAALVVALIGFLAFDLRVIEHGGPAAPALFTDTTLAVSPSDSGIDLIAFRLRSSESDLPSWGVYAPFQARDDNRSSRVRFAVPVVWTGR